MTSGSTPTADARAATVAPPGRTTPASTTPASTTPTVNTRLNFVRIMNPPAHLAKLPGTRIECHGAFVPCQALRQARSLPDAHATVPPPFGRGHHTNVRGTGVAMIAATGSPRHSLMTGRRSKWWVQDFPSLARTHHSIYCGLRGSGCEC